MWRASLNPISRSPHAPLHQHAHTQAHQATPLSVVQYLYTCECTANQANSSNMNTTLKESTETASSTPELQG